MSSLGIDKFQAQRVLPYGRNDWVVIANAGFLRRNAHVREYAAGVHRYELGLVKGRIDAGETPEQAADRELKEEAGCGARRIDVLRALTLAPTYMSHQSWLVVARDLYPERLPGDEPEELEVVPWKLQDLDRLMLREDFSEGRSLAALFIAREWLKERT